MGIIICNNNNNLIHGSSHPLISSFSRNNQQHTQNCVLISFTHPPMRGIYVTAEKTVLYLELGIFFIVTFSAILWVSFD